MSAPGVNKTITSGVDFLKALVPDVDLRTAEEQDADVATAALTFLKDHPEYAKTDAARQLVETFDKKLVECDSPTVTATGPAPTAS